MSNYKEEFMSYDDTLPELKGWTDASWHNDACPKFQKRIMDEFGTIYLNLWVDWKDPSFREVPDGRFVFEVWFEENIESSDQFCPLLAAETLEELRGKAIGWYLDNVGDSILEGDYTTAEILEQVGTMWGFHNRKPSEEDKFAKILEQHVISTGGGCLAYSFDHAGHFIWITDGGGTGLPREGEICLLGIRNDDGSEGSVIEVRFDAKAVIGFLNEIGADVYGPTSGTIILDSYTF